MRSHQGGLAHFSYEHAKFYFTVYSIMNMITAFSILLQLHGILLILVLLILDFAYLVVLVEASLKSNLEKIPKHKHAL